MVPEVVAFHPGKCHVLTLGKFQNITYTERYKMSKLELEHVFEEKDLGVIVDSEMKFEEHINSKVQKANSIIGLIRRSFSFLDELLFKQLYTAFVRPHLEYCQSAWVPHLKKHINMLENVQRRATKLVDGCKTLTYEERLRRLALPTFAFRRARGDMIELYKHFRVYDRLSLSNAFRPRTKLSRKHDLQLEYTFPLDGVRGLQFNAFYFRTTKAWNNLPREVVDAESVNTFTNRLDEH